MRSEEGDRMLKEQENKKVITTQDLINCKVDIWGKGHHWVACNVCGTPIKKSNYYLRMYDKFYCNNECRTKGRQDRITVDCANCGDSTIIIKSRYKSSATKSFFCNKKCQREYFDKGGKYDNI